MLQQTLGCLLQCREMRQRFQRQILNQFWHVYQQRNHSTIIFALMCLEDQNGKQLMLGELLWTEPVRVGWQRLSGNLQRFQRHLPW
jgi:hypothetical protein